MIRKKERTEAGDEVQSLSALDALSGDPTLIPNNTWLHTNICNSSLKGSDTFHFGLFTF